MDNENRPLWHEGMTDDEVEERCRNSPVISSFNLMEDIRCLKEQSSLSARCSIAWSENTPNQQCEWWWWNGDADAGVVLVSVLYSGTDGSYFASLGQHGWRVAQSVTDMGGMWAKAEIPEPPQQ